MMFQSTWGIFTFLQTRSSQWGSTLTSLGVFILKWGSILERREVLTLSTKTLLSTWCCWPTDKAKSQFLGNIQELTKFYRLLTYYRSRQSKIHKTQSMVHRCTKQLLKDRLRGTGLTGSMSWHSLLWLAPLSLRRKISEAFESSWAKMAITSTEMILPTFNSGLTSLKANQILPSKLSGLQRRRLSKSSQTTIARMRRTSSQDSTPRGSMR